jgi:hypothetical protein
MSKHGKLLAALAGLGLVATAVWGDNNVLNHGTYYGNAATGLKTDASGNLYMTNSSPLQDNNLTFASIISQSSLAAGAADSSAVLDTHAMRLGMLLIKATPQSVTGADSLATVRIGIQIRTHLNGAADSSSTFAIYQYGVVPSMAITAGVDTAYFGQIANGLNLAASSQGTFSGEFNVAIAINRIGPGTSILGSLGQRLFYYPNGIAIPIQNLFGRDIYSPYTSIRVRNLGTAGPANRTCIVTVSLVGTPL